MKMTPRKLHALLNVHYDIMKAKYGNGSTSGASSDGYIDTVPGW